MPTPPYQPSLEFPRSKAEKADPFLAWQRSDQAFFASGACHILAHLFWQLHRFEGYYKVYIKPQNPDAGTHVYVTNGTWAFDHNGWTPETDLIETTNKAYSTKYPGWKADFVRLPDHLDIEQFCSENNHRPPSYFAYLPWERAYKFIQRFDPQPPEKTK